MKNIDFQYQILTFSIKTLIFQYQILIFLIQNIDFRLFNKKTKSIPDTLDQYRNIEKINPRKNIDHGASVIEKINLGCSG